MSPEVMFSIAGALVTIGSIYGMLKSQTKTLAQDIDRLHAKVDRCVTKSDFPAFFAREKMASDPNGRGTHR